MKAIVISLPDSPRRAHLRENFGDAEIFDGVHGASEIEEFEDHVVVRGELRVPLDRALRLSIAGKPLTKGQMGCALSHYLLWRRLVASDDAAVLVMEDDARIDRPRFDAAMRNLPEPADVVYLQDVDGRFNTPPKIAAPYNAQFYRSFGPFPHTHGYVIHREHAQRLLDGFRLAFPADGNLGRSLRDNPALRVYCMYEPCIRLTLLAQSSESWTRG